MFFLTYISYLAFIIELIFISIAIGKKECYIDNSNLTFSFLAAGLYYLAELVEEYSTIAKKCIWWQNTVHFMNF